MSPIELTIKNQYDRSAQSYDRRWNRYITNSLVFLKTHIEISPSAAVLDVACGTGELERLLIQDNPSQAITGVDISEQMLAQAQQKLSGYPNVSFETATASQLPFADCCFDIVVSANAFHYFSNPEAALAEMQRVLKPDGKIVILDWCKDFLFCRICDWFLKRLDPAHQQCYTEAELHTLLEKSGLGIIIAQRMRFDVVWGLMIAAAVPKTPVQLLPVYRPNPKPTKE